MVAVVPVVFVLFGPAPLYLLCNVEQTMRHNPAIILGDITLLPTAALDQSTSSSLSLTLEKSAPYMSGARDFAAVYKHMCGGDDSPGRVRRELQNFQRWFVLRDYMRANKQLEHVFFSDGDSVLFGNATQALADRSECEAVINVEHQPGVLHMVAAGEASLWSLPALDSFCNYTMLVYQSSAAVKALQVKNQVRPAVVDMTLLWLWWVSQKDASDPDTSWIVPKWFPPPKSPQLLNSQEVAAAHASRSKNLLAFKFAKSLPLPNATLPLLHLCNGLDVVGNTLFDHMHAWTTNPKRFSFPVNDGGLPCTTADRGMHGGRPALNSTSGDGKICFLNVHYQGNYKEQLGRDVCRVLLPSASRVVLAEVRQACSKEWGRRQSPS